ncbi:MAG: type II secretion system F family protein, partial [Candidatus Omnitrophica bacterium]|nr:type II secretion system F family protein [Candidatus Omnitrophota bacterium]
MASFIYCVKDANGRSLHGLIEAEDKKEVKQRVNHDEYFFVSAQACSKEKIFNQKVNSQTLIMFTHRLTSLVEAGIPILSAMNILWRQTEDKAIQIVVSHMKNQLEQGSQISSAIDDFPNIFPLVFRALIRVGEMSGALVLVLRKLGEYLDYRAMVVSRTNKATLYPTIVIVFSLLVVVGMFAFVVPTFQKVLIKLRVELPWITKVIIGISDMIRSPIFIAGFFVFLILAFVAYKMIKNSDKLSYHIDKWMLKIPYFGNILFIFSLSQVVRSLSILLVAGVPIIESLQVASSTAGNRKIIADLDEIKHQIEQGSSLYDAFCNVKGFPVMLTEMVGVGESSGMLVQILEKLTKHFDEEVDYHLNRFLTILEPMLIIVVGAIVVITLLAIYLPVVSIWQGLMSHG